MQIYRYFLFASLLFTSFLSFTSSEKSSRLTREKINDVEEKAKRNDNKIVSWLQSHQGTIAVGLASVAAMGAVIYYYCIPQKSISNDFRIRLIVGSSSPRPARLDSINTHCCLSIHCINNDVYAAKIPSSGGVPKVYFHVMDRGDWRLPPDKWYVKFFKVINYNNRNGVVQLCEIDATEYKRLQGPWWASWMLPVTEQKEHNKT